MDKISKTTATLLNEMSGKKISTIEFEEILINLQNLWDAASDNEDENAIYHAEDKINSALGNALGAAGKTSSEADKDHILFLLAGAYEDMTGFVEADEFIGFRNAIKRRIKSKKDVSAFSWLKRV